MCNIQSTLEYVLTKEQLLRRTGRRVLAYHQIYQSCVAISGSRRWHGWWQQRKWCKALIARLTDFAAQGKGSLVMEKLQHCGFGTHFVDYMGHLFWFLLVEGHRHESYDVVKMVESYGSQGLWSVIVS
jgi:hypothetical protein